MVALMTKEQHAIMRNITSEFDIITQQKVIADQISKIAMSRLFELEFEKKKGIPAPKSTRKTPPPKDTVTAFESRLNKLKEKK